MTSLKDQFVMFSKFGDAKSDGKSITLTQSDKWLKQALILDGRHITVTDTGIVFNTFKSRTLTYQEFMRYIDALCKEHKLNREDVISRLSTCGPPGTNKMIAAKPDK